MEDSNELIFAHTLGKKKKKKVWNSKPLLVSLNEEILASKYIPKHFLCYKILDDEVDDVWETRWKIQTEIWIGKNEG